MQIECKTSTDILRLKNEANSRLSVFTGQTVCGAFSDGHVIRVWSERWESKSSPLGFSRTYEVGPVLFWKDLVASGTLTAASMPPCFPKMFFATLRFASRTALGTACV